MNGLAPVWSNQGYGFIDRTGQVVIDGSFDQAGNFNNERALIGRQKRFGFIDPTGKTVIAMTYTYGADFSEGLAAVREGEYSVGFVPACGFIDVDGNMVVKPRFDRADSFRDGLCLVTTKDSIGYINKQGEFVWNGPFVECGVVC